MGLFSGPKLNTLDDLFVSQISDLYDAETRLTEALPKMAEAATSKKLKTAFESHLKETEEHVSRLETIFEQLGLPAKRQTCQAMKGLLAEGDEVLDAEGEADVKDAALIAAAQRVEHYEMSGYGTAKTFARRLGHDKAVTLLEKTLKEEAAADEKLTAIAEGSVNKAAEKHH
ncbi:MAG: ferritin-like domain-containing protein [Isosphaeraceae bacterium]